MVSIITPTYNRAALISETIKTVLAQTYRDFEWIIADDGSDDDTEQVVNSFGDARIKYFKLAHTGRLPQIRNFAIGKANGEYIAFLDSDDLWRPKMLETSLSMLDKEPDLRFILADAEIIQDGKIIYRTIYDRKWKNEGRKFYNELFTDKLFVIFPSTLVVRKKALTQVGLFNEELKFGEKDLFTRLAFFFNARITDEVLVTINRHDANESSASHKGSLAEESFKEEIHTLDHFFMHHYIDRTFHKRMLGIYYFKLAEYYYGIRSFADAREAYSACLKRDGGNFKARIKRLLSGIKK